MWISENVFRWDLERLKDLQEQKYFRSVWKELGDMRQTWGKLREQLYLQTIRTRASQIRYLTLSLKFIRLYHRSVLNIVLCELEKLTRVCFKFDVFLNKWQTREKWISSYVYLISRLLVRYALYDLGEGGYIWLFDRKQTVVWLLDIRTRNCVLHSF